MTFSRETIDESTLKATIEVGAQELKAALAQAEAKLGQQITIDGFRQGKAPRDVVKQRLNPELVKEEALQLAVTTSLNDFARQEKLDVLEHYDFALKENTPEKLVYTITVSLYPVITLGAYRGITVEKQAVSVSEEELADVLKNIAESRAVTKEDGTKEVPAITDEFVQTLGQFTSVESLRDMVRTGLEQEKQDREQDRVRVELLGKIIANSQVPAPARMIEAQLDAMIAGLDSELAGQGMELGPYLAHLKKTQDELRSEWRAKAEEQVKMQLTIHAIAKAEQIRVNEQELQQAVEARVQQFLAGRPEGDAKALDQVDLDQVRSRILSSLLNKKVFEVIEAAAT